MSSASKHGQRDPGRFMGLHIWWLLALDTPCEKGFQRMFLPDLTGGGIQMCLKGCPFVMSVTSEMRERRSDGESEPIM
jgi:hypothetical protein